MTARRPDVFGQLEGCTAGQFFFWCPGCGSAHWVETDPKARVAWQWNGDKVKPTVSPSIRVQSRDGARETTCHFFIRSGELQMLSDCTHDLAGKTIPMVPWDEVP